MKWLVKALWAYPSDSEFKAKPIGCGMGVVCEENSVPRTPSGDSSVALSTLRPSTSLTAVKLGRLDDAAVRKKFPYEAVLEMVADWHPDLLVITDQGINDTGFARKVIYRACKASKR